MRSSASSASTNLCTSQTPPLVETGRVRRLNRSGEEEKALEEVVVEVEGKMTREGVISARQRKVRSLPILSTIDIIYYNKSKYKKITT